MGALLRDLPGREPAGHVTSRLTPEQDQMRHDAGILRSELDRTHGARSARKQNELLEPRGFDHRFQVLDVLLERERYAFAIGEAAAAPVETQDAKSVGQNRSQGRQTGLSQS